MLAACSPTSGTSSNLVAQTSSKATQSTPAIRSPHVKSPRATETPTANRVPVGDRRRAATYPNIPAADLPRHPLTPGIALAVSRAACACPATRAALVTSRTRRRRPSTRATASRGSRTRTRSITWISLSSAVPTSIRNLWPEPYAGRWGARTKDVLENRLHELVCEGRLQPRVGAAPGVSRLGSRDIGSTWAPRRPAGAIPAVTWPGGFYASSYPAASTIYCADDSAWHELSRAYLVHFATFTQAKARFPDYHLHQPC